MFLGILEKGILKLYEYYEYDRKQPHKLDFLYSIKTLQVYNQFVCLVW